MTTKQVTLTLELDEELIPLLAVAAPSFAIEEGDGLEARARATIEELIERATDGVTRPGAWERGWLVRALGEDWIAELEQDPTDPYAQRPKSPAKTPVPPTGQETQGGGS